ncbi:hypothetical protein [Streptomyces sp. NPDC096030]|uniref:hypothetical protein n=1 Tax=Streptomyces sp. NPDC096030 TaxID=3155423 RepID=UPI00332C19C6
MRIRVEVANETGHTMKMKTSRITIRADVAGITQQWMQGDLPSGQRDAGLYPTGNAGPDWVFQGAHVEYRIDGTDYVFGFAVWTRGEPGQGREAGLGWEAGFDPRADRFTHACTDRDRDAGDLTLECTVFSGGTAGRQD